MVFNGAGVLINMLLGTNAFRRGQKGVAGIEIPSAGWLTVERSLFRDAECYVRMWRIVL